VAVWNKALFDQVYSLPGWQWGVRHNRLPRFHYNWFAMQPIVQNMAARYQVAPGFAQISDVAIIGGGYGWVGELLSQTYGVNVVNVDTSEHVVNTITTSEEQELRDTLTSDGWDPDNLPVFMGPDWNTPVNPWDYWVRNDGLRCSITLAAEDMSTNGSRRNVRQALSNNMDAIITEEALDSQDTEADALVLIERCEQLRPNPNCNVVHLIDGSGQPSTLPFINYTTGEWRALLDTNGFNHWLIDAAGNVSAPGG